MYRSPSSFCFVFSSYRYTDKAFVCYLRIIRDRLKKSTMYKQNEHFVLTHHLQIIRHLKYLEMDNI